MRWPTLFRGLLSKGLASVPWGGGQGWSRIYGESNPGSWQKNIRMSDTELRQNPAVFACMSRIADDIAKLPLRLMSLDDGGIWSETTNPAYSPVLTSPNNYQNRQQFLESWIWSKLGHGNFYGLKVRDNRNVVIDIYPLDPMRVRPQISTDGNVQVFYELMTDHMAGIEATSIMVPAREIIHDRYNCMFHPLVGMSPLYAAHLPGAQGLEIQRNSTKFFRNGAQPSGVLSGPGVIDPDTAKRLEDQWEHEFQHDNVGKVAVLGSGLTFKPMQMSAEASQVVNQNKAAAEQVCMAFHVPLYKVGLGTTPAGLNIESFNIEYFSQALQPLIDSIDNCLSDGLGLAPNLRVRVDIEDLLRMDTLQRTQVLTDGVKGGVLAPNEARKKLGYKKVPGGDLPYMQQQNFSLEALAKRDASEDPFAAVRETFTGPSTEEEPKPLGSEGDNEPDAAATDQAAAAATESNAAKALEEWQSELLALEFSFELVKAKEFAGVITK